MEGFTYQNIFDTKGIEYIVIIAFLLILIPFWFIMNKEHPAVQKMKAAWDALTESILRIPQGIFYSPNHTWAFLERSGNARIGIDDLLVKLVGESRVTPLVEAGSEITKGTPVAEISQGDKKLRIPAPVSGVVTKANNDLLDEPVILMKDPYEKGWLLTVRPSNWKTDTAEYTMGSEASGWIKNELKRFKDFLAVSLGKYQGTESMIAFQEGGELKMHPMKELQAEIWKDFQSDFLDSK